AAFDKVTTEQIIPVNISSASGFTTSKQNMASLKNSGIETFVQVAVLNTDDFNWTTSWNNTYLSTEVLDVGNESGTFLVNRFNDNGNEFLGELRYTEGMAMNQLYVRTYRTNAEGQILLSDNGRLLETTGATPGAE